MANVKILTSSTCPYCNKAKALFDSLNVSYEEIDVVEHPEVREEMAQKYNWMTVPMILINDEFLGGYDDVAKLHAEGVLQQKLDA